MIKAFFLIFEPSVAWERLAISRRSFWFVFGTYLLPTIILVTAVEGWGLHRWGKWQPKFQRINLTEFTTSTVITFEVIQALLMLGMVLVSALVLLKISQTFENRRTYRQAFITTAYGLSPMFVAHLLNAAPMMSPWTPWFIGIILTVWVLYQGIPRVLQPDPTHAFGLYLSAIIVVILTSGIVRVLTGLYLLGQVDFNHSWLMHKFSTLFS